MLAVAVPTLNEADNIEQLTQSIDRAAVNLGIQIVIINADNHSADGTARLFAAANTVNAKISLHNNQKGKGRNIKSVLEYVTTNREIEYCFFIDGDVTSFDVTWLAKHYEQYKQGTDYVVPNYARSMQEGNTTNHFAFPLLYCYTSDRAPQQPIAGDFGVSARLMTYLLQQPWSDSVLGYGVDIFMTMHALFGDFDVVEIALDRKLHKPSYGKMVGMFEEVATSYYETTARIAKPAISKHARKLHLHLLDAPRIAPEALDERRAVALHILDENRKLGLNFITESAQPHIDATTWANILADHTTHIDTVAPSQLAKSILPYYLLRAVSYLTDNKNAAAAQQEILQQANIILETFQTRGL